MNQQGKVLKPPRGLSRLAYRLPVWLYRLGLGGLLGTRFLLLVHTGRKSGKKHRTVLEVIRHDKVTHTFVVAAGFGPKSDWYRNLRVNTQVTICSGRHCWDVVATFLSPEQAGDEMLDYARRHPLALRLLFRFMGLRYDGSQASVRALGDMLPMVSFQPKI